MSIIATSVTGSDRYPDVSVGVHKARCVRVIDLGTQWNEYQGEGKWKRQCMIQWEVPAEKKDDGEPMIISKFYTLSLHEKATLGADLSAWRGRAFTEQEKAGFDIAKLAGVPCMMNVVEGNKGRPKIATLMPLPKGDDLEPQYHSTVVFSVDEYQKGEADAFNALPEGIRNMILKSQELESSQTQDKGDGNNGASTMPPNFTSDVEPDDVPF